MNNLYVLIQLYIYDSDTFINFLIINIMIYKIYYNIKLSNPLSKSILIHHPNDLTLSFDI